MGLARVSQTLVGLLALQPALIAGLPAPEPVPSPPGVPSASTAKSELAGLAVASQGSQEGYSRSKFPHWIKQTGWESSLSICTLSHAHNCAAVATPVTSCSSEMGRMWHRLRVAVPPPVAHGFHHMTVQPGLLPVTSILTILFRCQMPGRWAHTLSNKRQIKRTDVCL
jgi:hypothetical protein